MTDGGRAFSESLGGARAGLLLLLAAAFVLAGVIGYRAWQGGSEGSAGTAIGTGHVTIDQLRAEAEDSNDDAEPWQQLGFAYFQRGEFADAVGAYQRAVAIEPDEATLWSALGEALVMASQRDPMPSQALDAFTRASSLDPADPRARYFLHVNKDLEGDHEGAISGWLALLEDTPSGAPWEQDLVRTIEQVGAINGIKVGPRIEVALAGRGNVLAGGTGFRGPTQAEIAAAASIPPSEQRSMAEGMVARLEARLRQDPSDLQGWLMLMRSRMTLGEPAMAASALQAAIAANPRSETRLREEAARLGIH